MTRMRRGAVLILTATFALVTACSTLPTSGEVTTEPGASETAANQAPFFVPPAPVPGADREAIVRGFLLAAQANPPSTSVARSFLSERARSTWKPAGTIVYESLALEANAVGVVAQLSGANRLDRSGKWQPETQNRVMDLSLNLVLEEGEWRISNPPTALPVPTSYFRNTYLPYLVYFFDRTGTVLVPERIYLPRGEQVASSLVRGLLAGPAPGRAGSAVSAFGGQVDLDLSVVVSKEGVAEVPLSTDVLQLSRADLYRALVQLAATLRQLPGLVRIRVTVDGVAMPLIDGQTDVGVDVAPEFDPVAAPAGDLVAIDGGKVVLYDGTDTRPIGGPFGDTGLALRSVAQSIRENQIAGVTQDGRRAYLAPTVGDRDQHRVRTVIDGATNLLRPSFDRFGNLWAVDAAKGGAIVHVIRHGRDRIVEVRGVSGTRVSAFTVTRDGASLVVGLARGATPTLRVSALVRGGGGRLVRALPAQGVLVKDADLASIVDVAQDSATDVAVLTRSTSRGSRVFSVELDGSPVGTAGSALAAVPGEAVSLLAGPDDQHPVLVVTADGQLLRSSSPGEWVRLTSGFVTAVYPQ